MDILLEKIAVCVEKGKVNAQSPYPPEMKDQEGVDELMLKALETGISAQKVLSESLIKGMQRVGEKFRKNEIYLPDVLMAARSMNAGMSHIKPYILSGNVEYQGKIIIGTVVGDMHDIGKKIVGMFFEGGGWEVIDCGVDVSENSFIQAITENNPDAVGLSALLTTTMMNMKAITGVLKTKFPNLKILVGGAPVTQDFADSIGADIYSPYPQGALEKLKNSLQETS